MIKLYHAQGSLGLRRVEHGSYGERSRNGHESKLEERPSLAPGRHHLNALGASCGCTALTAWTCLTTLLPPCLGSEDFSATHTREQALMARIHFTEGPSQHLIGVTELTTPDLEVSVGSSYVSIESTPLIAQFLFLP